MACTLFTNPDALFVRTKVDFTHLMVKIQTPLARTARVDAGLAMDLRTLIVRNAMAKVSSHSQQGILIDIVWKDIFAPITFTMTASTAVIV
jgi:hypothetical protein